MCLSTIVVMPVTMMRVPVEYQRHLLQILLEFHHNLGLPNTWAGDTGVDGGHHHSPGLVHAGHWLSKS